MATNPEFVDLTTNLNADHLNTFAEAAQSYLMSPSAGSIAPSISTNTFTFPTMNVVIMGGSSTDYYLQASLAATISSPSNGTYYFFDLVPTDNSGAGGFATPTGTPGSPPGLSANSVRLGYALYSGGSWAWTTQVAVAPLVATQVQAPIERTGSGHAALPSDTLQDTVDRLEDLINGSGSGNMTVNGSNAASTVTFPGVFQAKVLQGDGILPTLTASPLGWSTLTGHGDDTFGSLVISGSTYSFAPNTQIELGTINFSNSFSNPGVVVSPMYSGSGQYFVLQLSIVSNAITLYVIPLVSFNSSAIYFSYVRGSVG